MRKTIAAFAAGLAVSAGLATGAIRPEHDRATVAHPELSTARVHGCAAEDACRIDYRPRGVWVITRVHP
jgi:hypothetical protein